MEFFGQNHGLTLLGKSNVWDLNKEHFYNKERHLFYYLEQHFCQKLAISPFSTFKQNTPGKCVSRYSRKKKSLSRLWKQQLKKFENWVFLRNCEFFHFFILSNIRQQNVFQDILERKKTFLDNKINNLKKSKKGIFLKGLVHSFVQKLAIVSFFFILGKIRQENVFQDMLER